MIAESSAAVFADFGKTTILRKKDGSATISTLGLYDEAGTEYDTEHASVRSKQPQLTVPASPGADYGEGDFADHDGKSYQILDNLSDSETSVLIVTELSV